MTKGNLICFENIGTGSRIDAGCDAYDLSSFFDAIKKLPENQKQDLSIITDEEDLYFSGEHNFMLQNLSNEFIKIAPIIFYRIIENHLKKKLLELYASRLTEKMVDKKGKRKGRKKTINKIIVGANLETIKYMFELVNERLKKIPRSIFCFFAHLEEKTR